MVAVRGLLQTWLAPLAACMSGKTCLREISHLQSSLRHRREQEDLRNTEEVVSWGNGSKYGGGSEQKLLLREWFLFLLSKAHRDR